MTTRLDEVFHFLGWFLPGAQAMIVLTMSAVDGDPVGGLCYVGGTNLTHLKAFVLAPLSLYLVLGTGFLVSGFVALFKIRSAIKLQGPEAVMKTEKLEKLMLRIGIFGLLYTLPAITVLGCLGYELANRVAWERGHNCPCSRPVWLPLDQRFGSTRAVDAAVTASTSAPASGSALGSAGLGDSVPRDGVQLEGDEQLLFTRLLEALGELLTSESLPADEQRRVAFASLTGLLNPTSLPGEPGLRLGPGSISLHVVEADDPEAGRFDATRPEYAVFMLKYFMSLVVGITSGFWIWSSKTLAVWQACLRGICRRQSHPPTLLAMTLARPGNQIESPVGQAYQTGGQLRPTLDSPTVAMAWGGPQKRRMPSQPQLRKQGRTDTLWFWFYLVFTTWSQRQGDIV
ncbi:unnamed protein product [Protopolystoma xenopodis]|uniref:G-protein coupled receptors family 2 profile 2 domain-containing protein n=1 Tax=Protopolystoma xenopodis TaxID=117903 RepID=A0A3S5C8A5_9PLAT|nr:unnamed protein product [Protopolystoma xenopodis]